LIKKPHDESRAVGLKCGIKLFAACSRKSQKCLNAFGFFIEV
jgi:hypothetical protein